MILFFLTLLIFKSDALHSEVSTIRPKAYFDVESGTMIFNKIITIKDQKIISIKNADLASENKSELKDIYLLPGFTDCHTHLLFTQLLEDNGFEGALVRESKLNDNFRIKRAKVFLEQYLHEGFTSLCDLGNSGMFLDSKLRQETNSRLNYPKIFISGPGIATKKAQFLPSDNDKMVSKEYSIIDSKTNINNLLSIYSNKKIDILKLYLDNSPGTGNMDSEILNNILSNPLISNFKKVTFHASDIISFNTALRFKLQNLEHLNQITLTKNVLNNLKFITPTDQDIDSLKEFNYYNKNFYIGQIQRLKFLSSSKILLIFGPDFYFHKNGINFNRAKYVKRTLKTYFEANISAIEIIRALTINPALSLGQGHNFGQIKVNAFANFVGFKKNPLLDKSILLETPIVFNRGKRIK